MSAMQNTAVVQPNRRKSLKQWLRSMRGQQILVTLAEQPRRPPGQSQKVRRVHHE